MIKMKQKLLWAEHRSNQGIFDTQIWDNFGYYIDMEQWIGHVPPIFHFSVCFDHYSLLT